MKKIFISVVYVLSILLFIRIVSNGTKIIEELNELQNNYELLKEENQVLTQNNEDLLRDIADVEEKYIGLQDELRIQTNMMLQYIEPLKDTDKATYLEIYKNLIDPTSLTLLEEEFSEEQIEIMYRCIETETYGAPLNAKVNVASVILNRVRSDMFPTDPIEIITAPNQFAYSKRNISEDTKIALEYAYLFGSEMEDCVAFRHDKCPQTWCKWEYYKTDEVGHHFYKPIER